MAPVARALARHPRRFETFIVLTSQHREMLQQMVRLFGLRVDHDLGVMTENQTLAQLTARILEGLEPVLRRIRPDFVLVQGDTATTFAATLAAFYQGIPVGHVEAGLRTYDLRHPFPEEANRVMTSLLTALHFAPTPRARDNLIAERVPAARIAVTGNTGIDALYQILGLPFTPPPHLRPLALPGWKMLVTMHRRENHGAPLVATCRAIAELLRRIDSLRVIFPVHLSPQVSGTVHDVLGGHDRVHLLPPLGYQEFVHAMNGADLILSDSGGVQEEAPALGKPVLVLRDATERPEAADAGATRLIGTDPDRIIREVLRLFRDDAAYREMAQVRHLYGGGRAGQRIVAAIARYLQGAAARTAYPRPRPSPLQSPCPAPEADDESRGPPAVRRHDTNLPQPG